MPIFTMARLRTQQVLIPVGWLPQQSQFGTEGLTNPWRDTDFQSMLEEGENEFDASEG